MKNKKTLRVITALVFAMLLCGMIAAPMTAYAYSDEGAESECETVTPEPTPEPEPTPTPDPQPLTPHGNLTLVDDISGEQAHDKQFITVVTKSGNYFYLVIDRAGDRENVHFLNLVDEADLMAIMEDGNKQAVTPAPVEPTPEPTPEPEPAPEPEKSNTGGLVIALVLLGALGGGAFYYFKVLKPKQAVQGGATTELDDFDFDGDEDDWDEDTEVIGGGRLPYDAEYAEDGGGDYDDIPDFTAAPDSGPDGFSDDFGNFEAQESEGEQ